MFQRLSRNNMVKSVAVYYRCVCVCVCVCVCACGPPDLQFAQLAQWKRCGEPSEAHQLHEQLQWPVCHKNVYYDIYQ